MRMHAALLFLASIFVLGIPPPSIGSDSAMMREKSYSPTRMLAEKSFAPATVVAIDMAAIAVYPDPNEDIVPYQGIVADAGTLFGTNSVAKEVDASGERVGILLACVDEWGVITPIMPA
jgi:hypothetical protein